MNYLWSITVEDYIEAIELATSRGVQVGQSIERELLEVLKKKGRKSFGATELNRDELLKEYASHGKKILSIEVDEKGKTILKTNQGLDKQE